MFRLQRGVTIMALLLLIATPALAAENTFKNLFEDAFYGGLTGSLVGAAVLAFSKKPGRHLDYIGYGAAAGVIVGATYGAVTTTRSLAEVENGKVHFSIPTIIPEIQEKPAKGQTGIVAMTELVRGRF